MALTRLPNELLDNIIECTLPQGFESVALTCKRIHARCTPFIKRHNELRSRFRDFTYYVDPRGSLVAASDLITLIAAEPIVARYIRTANLSVPSIDDGGAVDELFASSTYLRQAGLDWKEYYATFGEDVREKRYSQHGTALLLTLLPNTEKLTIPKLWRPNAVTNKLLDILVDRAKQSSLLSPASSLALVTRFDISLGQNEQVDLSWATPFLTLPRIASFHGSRCLASGDNPRSLAFRGSRHMAETLQVANLASCCIDDVGIAELLKHTPRLKTLRYWHYTKYDSPIQDWDICKFVNVVAREAGSHLVELSVAIRELRGSIIPGKASMRGFQKLEKLEYPLELVMCNINATGAASHIATLFQRFLNGLIDPFVRDLIPTSVAQLSLKSEGTDSHEKALNDLFRHFRPVRKPQLPALQEIDIACPSSADDVYKQQCHKIVAEASGEGVVVRLQPFDYT
ncbi:hypothetical protein NA57DRAFT_80014 [Rhizodiscina lignyota]|uniref:F-box domain-containing protein n=1 Tax=Rhizodiscina lignyota TaxID=1504668 RepID=A0A9P4I8V2_9PEZI|nr:hypothetical protein NA57DRAFT_80014 [Rhizodiscina lignyota]